MSADASVVGLVLAAGSGSRLGGPKAMLRDQHGATWVARAVASLVEGGVRSVYVVVGASGDAVRAAVPRGADIGSGLDIDTPDQLQHRP